MCKKVLIGLMLFATSLKARLDDDGQRHLVDLMVKAYEVSCQPILEELEKSVPGTIIHTAFSNNILITKFDFSARLQVWHDESEVAFTRRKASGISSRFKTVHQADDIFKVESTLILTEAVKLENELEEIPVDTQGLIMQDAAQGSYREKYYYDKEYNRLQKTTIIKCIFFK